MLAAGFGSNPNVATFIFTIGNILFPGIAFDTMKELISSGTGGQMKKIIKIIICCLGCCGDMV